MHVCDIKWDTDGESQEALGLPDETILKDMDDSEDVADALSDAYGFCVFSFDCD